ncbi:MULTISPECIES: MarR family winged helix-turn-helix transcriptional regulator [unclassified Nocardia]|uniref:MarR family winged helix-turn-helix transcriptional regulator n=1 Tax=unclassified Nocardia TaxID=2637762 RepID=UPI0033BC8BB3
MVDERSRSAHESDNELTPRERLAWRTYLAGKSNLDEVVNRQLEQGHNLSFPEFRILLALHRAPQQALRMSVLADRVHVSRGQLTHLVRALEARDLVLRKPDPHDRRGVVAHLTPTGSRTVEAALPGHERIVRDHFVEPVTDIALDTVADAFGRIARNTTELSAGTGKGSGKVRREPTDSNK